MSARKFRNEASRYARLAQQATTPTVQAHLLRLARDYQSIAAELEQLKDTAQSSA
jgi:hypothetical protein